MFLILDPIYHNIQLSFNETDVKRTIIKQSSDQTHILCIELYDTNGQRTIDPAWDISISSLKSDNTHILNSNNILVENNVIYVTMTKQMLAAPGTAKCELVIQSNGKALISNTFLIYVEPNVQDGDFIESSNEYNTIVDTLNYVQEKKDTVDQLADEIQETYDELADAVEQTNGLIAENEIIKSNEAARIEAENIRNTNEENRITDTATAILNAEAATLKANSAADALQNKLDSHYFVLAEDKGNANGIAELDANGKVPANQLPSYVDDVIEGYLYDSKFYEESAYTTEITGETGKIYIDLLTNKTYRWSGSAFVVISETLALGETSSTAYRGDRGKIAYDHSQDDTKHIPAGETTDSGKYLKATATAGSYEWGDITKSDIISALGYTPGSSEPITYSAGTGISLSGTTFSNSGVISIATGSSNGTISVNTNGTSANVSVKGLGSAAYTASSAYAAASHSHNYLPLSGGTVTGSIYFNGDSVTYPGYISHDDTSLTIKAPSANIAAGINGIGNGCGLIIKSCYNGILPFFSRTQVGSNADLQCLGSSTYKFGTIYSVSSALNSDQKLKKDIDSLDNDIETFNSLFDDIDFVKFRWKDNYNGALETSPSRRYHYGIIAQEVEKLMHKHGLTNYDNGFIHSNFFLDNTTECYITGGYRCAKEGYDYSQNVWNYKNDEEYEIYNEVIEKKFNELDYGGRYTHRPDIQYILIQDVSKVRSKGKQPPLTINSINLIDKEGNYVPIPLSTEGGISCYDPEDENFENPGSSATVNDNGSITISFNDMWGSYMIKIADNDNCFNFYDYESIIADVDFIGEYKIYLIPKGNYQTCDFWNDRDRTDEVAYDYTFNYQELTNMSLAVLQQTRKDYLDYKKASESKISELEEKISGLQEIITNITGGD